MKKSQVEASVVAAIQQIQTSSGRSTSGLTGSTKPIGELNGFDSLNCVEFSFMLSTSLGCEISQDISLFALNGQPQTIDQIVEKLCQIVAAEDN